MRPAMAIRMEIKIVNKKVLGLLSNETSKMRSRTTIQNSDFHPDDYFELVMVISMEIGGSDLHSDDPPSEPSIILIPILISILMTIHLNYSFEPLIKMRRVCTRHMNVSRSILQSDSFIPHSSELFIWTIDQKRRGLYSRHMNVSRCILQSDSIIEEWLFPSKSHGTVDLRRYWVMAHMNVSRCILNRTLLLKSDLFFLSARDISTYLRQHDGGCHMGLRQHSHVTSSEKKNHSLINE